MSRRGWRHTVEVALFDISNSTKPHPSVFRAYASKWRPVVFLFEATHLDEVSNRIPPTSQSSAAPGGLSSSSRRRTPTTM